jgi:hypothetical protein
MLQGLTTTIEGFGKKAKAKISIQDLELVV